MLEPIYPHLIQAGLLAAAPLIVSTAATITRTARTTSLSPTNRARLRDYAASPAKADPLFAPDRSPRTQRSLLRFLRKRSRIEGVFFACCAATAAGCALAYFLIPPHRGVWVTPFLGVVFGFMSWRFFDHWARWLDIYHRAIADHSPTSR